MEKELLHEHKLKTTSDLEAIWQKIIFTERNVTVVMHAELKDV